MERKLRHANVGEINTTRRIEKNWKSSKNVSNLNAYFIYGKYFLSHVYLFVSDLHGGTTSYRMWVFLLQLLLLWHPIYQRFQEPFAQTYISTSVCISYCAVFFQVFEPVHSGQTPVLSLFNWWYSLMKYRSNIFTENIQLLPSFSIVIFRNLMHHYLCGCCCCNIMISQCGHVI